MAGSLKHVVGDDGAYRGVDLLETMGDMHEAVEEMAFALMTIARLPGGTKMVTDAIEQYLRCCRGEAAWPDWFSNR